MVRSRSLTRATVAILLGAIFAMLIWTLAPWINTALESGDIGNGILPSIVIFLALLLAMVVNPLLRAARPALALTGHQLALIVAVTLMATAVTGSGLFRWMPVTIAHLPTRVSQDKPLADCYRELDLPADMFPDPMEYGGLPVNGEWFLTRLPPGHSVPWEAWVGPAVIWGSLMLFVWLMMIGLAMISLPQWRDNERLAFPLLTLQQSLIEPPGEAAKRPRMLARRGFWIATGAVFLIHGLRGLDVYFPATIPTIPIEWDIKGLFTEPPWNYIPTFHLQHQITFAIIGIAFFMSSRSAFSIWFFMIAYSFWRMYGDHYGNQNHIWQMDDHRTGAMLVLAIAVIYIGRRHWRAVASSMFRSARNATDRRNRDSGWVFVVGVAGFVGWMCWFGLSLQWAIAFAVYGFLVTLIVTRFVAETGVPVIRIYDHPLMFIPHAPSTWLSPITLFMAGVMKMVFAVSSGVNTGALSQHALAIDREGSPRQQSRLAVLFVVLLIGGFVVCGAVYLNINYHHSMTIDGANQPLSSGYINNWWSSIGEMNTALLEHSRGELGRDNYTRWPHFLFGGLLAMGLFALCLTFPWWPLHPLGYLTIDSHFGHVGWASVFIGWALRGMIVRVGGSRLYERAKAWFLGIIVGEVMASLFWAVLPAILVWAGYPDYERVTVMRF
jgi:hypothetical protein